MRSSNCWSSRKFWPSALVAVSPWRAITSRKGGSVTVTASYRRCGDAGGRSRCPGAILRAEGRELDGGDGRPGIGLVGAGDVECGAMIGGGAHDRQPERQVHAFVEMESLERDQRLVVIQAERRV